MSDGDVIYVADNNDGDNDNGDNGDDDDGCDGDVNHLANSARSLPGGSMRVMVM